MKNRLAEDAANEWERRSRFSTESSWCGAQPKGMKDRPAAKVRRTNGSVEAGFQPSRHGVARNQRE
jgi:hypothetical protein